MNSLSCVSSKLYESPKVTAVESSLQECLLRFREVVADFEILCAEAEHAKVELLTFKEKCESKSCSGSEELKKIIAAKDNIIQLVAAAATRLLDTGNVNIVEEILRIICDDNTYTTPRKNNGFKLEIPLTSKAHKKIFSPRKESPAKIKENVPSPMRKKGLKNSPLKIKGELIDNVSKDESVSEIEGTPTGRTSPVIQSRKLKTASASTPEQREKKKCPKDWYNPVGKQARLCAVSPSGAGRGLRQSRLSFRAVRPDVVDLTGSPHFAGGAREQSGVQKLIKKEPSDNDDTILPSPTSGLPDSIILSKSFKDKEKFKRPLSLKSKSENNVPNIPAETKDMPLDDVTRMDESINILQLNRYAKTKPPKRHQEPMEMKQEPGELKQELGELKREPMELKQEPVKSCSEFETENSISLLQNVKENMPGLGIYKINILSSHNRPLAENINLVNLTQHCSEASESLLKNNPPASPVYEDDIEIHGKRNLKTPEKVVAVYKEVLPRTRVEKMAMPGWCCDECQIFYGELYKNDPDEREKIGKVVAACSKHRGRSNPARPRTPPGYWQPRWHVPTDTEEFNRRNDAL